FFGKILGIFAVAALAVFASYALGPMLAGMGGIFSATVAGTTATWGAVTAAAIGAGVGQFGLSLAQGANFKQALVAGLISGGAIIATAGIAQFLASSGVQSLLGQIGKGFADAIKPFAKNLVQGFASPTLKEGQSLGGEMIKQTLKQSSVRFGSQQFSETF